MSMFIPGQRWFSTAEPELGLGTVMRVNGRAVQIVFTGSGVVRQYAGDSAPLARAEFRAGDTVRVDGHDLVVEMVTVVDGLIQYTVAGKAIHEGMLDAEQPVSRADARLRTGRVDPNDAFEFRVELLNRRANALKHPGWGVLAARIDLIPHQLRVAEIVAERRPPRLLFADEVGLGKTIEAGLAIAQLVAAGRAGRVLVLAPESLVNQWFVELLRRFNLNFAIFDEERCESIEVTNPRKNPFEDEQFVVASVNWLADSPKRASQAKAAGWDLLVVDEAHHLAWSETSASPGYLLVEALSQVIPAVFLLTATPEQLGLGGHFARLRLLDPARYSSLAEFEKETARFVGLSATVEKLLEASALDEADKQALAELLGDDASLLPEALANIEANKRGAVDKLVDVLIDRHGTGRAMVRNRRAAVGGFPSRVRHIERLDSEETDPLLEARLLAEFLSDIGVPGHHEPEHDYAHDPRFEWLLKKLDELAPQKVLLLCRSRAKVQALEEALRTRSGIAVARFHEDMSLLQRDRNAAYFAETDGARLLIASEVGAEGRNFQFAQHLILWDLPADPDMLEQRIGRLDRIGQRGDVHIHAVALSDSPQDVLLRWYDEGLDAFSQVSAAGRELMRRFSDDLLRLVQDYGPGEAREAAFAQVLAQTRTLHGELLEKIAKGRDRLLELASRRGAEQSLLRDALARDDRQASLDDFALRLLERFGIHHEVLDGHVYLLDPEYLTLDAFEEFKSGPRRATLDRATALSRDDVLYLRDDHPLLLSATDLLLSAETGNATVLIDDSLPARSVLLEAVYLLECVADRRLHVSRYLPPQPLTAIVDTRLADRSDFRPSARALSRASERPVELSRYRKILETLLPPMLERAASLVSTAAQAVIDQAANEAATLLGEETARLEALAKVNPAVHPEEVEALRAEAAALAIAIPKARPRLDALRLIVSPDFLAFAR